MGAGASVDLVVPTVGRTRELAYLLESVANQDFDGRTRVILVDQNPDERLSPVVEAFRERVSLLRVSSDMGESRACNVGFRQCTADIIGRPDDDCWYPPDVLRRVVATFEDHPGWDALSGMCRDDEGRPTQLRWDDAAGPITRTNIFRRAIATTLFYRRSLVESLGDWDESFGVRPFADGSVGGASGETEYLLRALAAGFTLGYEPGIVVHHPAYAPSFRDEKAMRKAYSYGLDHSRLLKKYRFPLAYAGWRSAQLFGAAGMFLARGQPGTARFYASMAAGRARGMLAPRA